MSYMLCGAKKERKERNSKRKEEQRVCERKARQNSKAKEACRAELMNCADRNK